MNRFIILLTAAFIAWFLGQGIRRAFAPDINKRMCEYLCDVRGRRLGSIDDKGLVVKCICGSRIKTKRPMQKP